MSSRPGFGPQSWDLGLKAGNWASRLEFGPQDWDFGLETGIWASRLGFEGGTKKMEEKEEKEKIPHMCESIGHRPLWGRCPKRTKKWKEHEEEEQKK